METLASEKVQKVPEKYSCNACDYNTSRHSQYLRHLTTSKHINNIDFNQMETEKFVKEYKCENCDKIYKDRSGLWKHSKTCKLLKETPEPEKPDIVDVLINENKEFKNVIIDLMKSNHDLQKQMLEICKNSNTTNNNTNINSHNNKTFNMQIFLNEKCKDAMNIMDFVNTFQLQFSDLERIGEVGYVEGISSIIINKLNEMDIHKRPIHCSDAKREIMYVKDNDVWDKDNENNDKIRLAIRYISKKNSELVVPWRDLHPGVRNYDHRLNDKYQEIIIQSIGGKNMTTEDGETKIIRKISKMVLIDKNNL
jgi:hypothetical protein